MCKKSGITNSINYNFGKIKIDSCNSLPIKKILTSHNVIILIKSVVNKNENKYYCNIFLEKGSYKDKWTFVYYKSVCNFQSMKCSVELNSLLSKFYCFITWLLYQLIRRDTGRLTNEALTSNPIVSSKQ